MDRYWYLVAMFRFFVDFLLILGANQLTGAVSDWKRAVLAALIGGVQAAGCFLPGFFFLAKGHWRLIAMVLTALVAFGLDRPHFSGALLFVLLRLAMDAVAEGGIWAMLAVGGIVLLLCVRGKPGKGSYAEVSMSHRGKTVELTALLDTGNTLKDPISGLGVLVVGSDVAQKLVGLREEALSRPVETMAAMAGSGLRLIPYTSIGRPSGFLLGIRLDSLKINGEQAEWIVAFAPQRIGQENGYQALAGGMV